MESGLTSAGADRRLGDQYLVSPDEVERFHHDGYVHLAGVLSEEELRPIEEVYLRFLAREIPVPGKDFCDMSGAYGGDPAGYALINVMLPRRYYPAWQGNLYERRAASIARQLRGDGLVVDYDQLLAKPPRRTDAVFAWHQDQAYWIATADARTATAWLALDDSTEENGCMRFLPGSHKEPALRRHRPLHGDRETSHTLVAEVDETKDRVALACIKRGDVTVHSERVVHGSGGNRSDRWRRAYVVAFRSRETVAEERRRGFSHSHNDELAVLSRVGTGGRGP